MRPEEFDGRRDEAGECGDYSSRFVEVEVGAFGWIWFGKSELLGGRTHQHHSSAADNFDCRYVCEFADIVVIAGGVGGARHAYEDYT